MHSIWARKISGSVDRTSPAPSMAWYTRTIRRSVTGKRSCNFAKRPGHAKAREPRGATDERVTLIARQQAKDSNHHQSGKRHGEKHECPSSPTASVSGFRCVTLTRRKSVNKE